MELNSRTNPMYETWDELFNLWGKSQQESLNIHDEWHSVYRELRSLPDINWRNCWGFFDINRRFLRKREVRLRKELDKSLDIVFNYRTSYLTIKSMLFPGE